MNLSDAVYFLGVLFDRIDPPPCEDTCDANDDGSGDIADAVSILIALFGPGSPLPAPDLCGEDPTADALGCLSFSGCL